MTKTIEESGEVLRFWFGELRDGWPTEDRGGLWFRDGAKHDPEIVRRFGETLARAQRGGLDDWAETAEGALALIVVLDQFTRCVHRGTALAFSNDGRAVSETERVLSRGWDAQMALAHRQFIYMPLMHSEDLAHQERSVALFDALAALFPPERKEIGESTIRHAREHRDLIARFGRFPHRNQILERESTPDEARWLEQNSDKNYGQG